MQREWFCIPLVVVVGAGAASCGPARQPTWTPPQFQPNGPQIIVPMLPPTPGAPPILPESASPLTFERIVKYPEPGWTVPMLPRFSPDGRMVTYLKSEDGTSKTALFAFDLESKTERVVVRASDLGTEKQPSQAEELRAERQRKRITGISAYAFAGAADVMVIPAGGDVFVRGADGAITNVTHSDEAELDPQLCPTGQWVAYVRGSELFATDLKTKQERPLTRNAKPGITRGQSDFNGQEEFEEEHGFFWSDDCKRIAYLEVDETAVAEIPVMGYRDHGGGFGTDLMMQRYPEAGATNPTVSLNLYDFDAVTSRKVKLDEPLYTGRYTWSPDGKSLYFEAIPRSQKELRIMKVDVAKATASVLWTESPQGWAEMRDLEITPNGSALVAIGDNLGHDHAMKIDTATGATTWLTSGAWEVTSIPRVTDDTVYFVGTKDAPIGRQLYAVPLAGAPDPTRLTKENGTHTVSLGTKGFVDVLSSSVDLPRVAITSYAGESLGAVAVPKDADFDALRIRPVATFSVDVQGARLYGQVLPPRDLDPTKRYPLVLYVYGGPAVQSVTDRWSPKLLWQHWADRGFFVAQIDNRGGAGRGQAFAAPIAGKLGMVELADQIAGLDWMLANMPIDGSRVAIYGHSYGGTMALQGLLGAPGRFKAGISASPVTDWRLYDTGYTERYMGTPKDNLLGYDEADLTTKVDALTGKLFLIHALMDENVHFQNSAKLIDALVAKQKDFDSLVLPGERHGYRDPKTKQYVYRRITNFLVETLAP